MDDVISRGAALKVVCDTCQFVSCPDDDKCDEYEAMKNLPSAEPKRPRGKWLSHNDYCKKYGYIPSGLTVFWWCDQCEQGTDYSTNFCPNCGADMRGE